MSDTVQADFHEGDIVRNRNTGGKLVVRGDETVWLSRFYELVSCPHQAASSTECRRVADPAPAPYAVRKSARRTCIEQLAEGWSDCVSDLCPACLRQVMAALDGIGGSLSWHEAYQARASEGVAR